MSYTELFDKLLEHEFLLKYEDLKKTTTHVTATIDQHNMNNSSAQCKPQCQPANNNGRPPNI